MYHFGVTGTQNGLNTVQIANVKDVLAKLMYTGFEYMHNGKCIGADHDLAILWDQIGGKVCWHPPTNAYKMTQLLFNGETSELPAPYLDRNKVIVDRSRVLVACPKETTEQLRSGTWATIRHARRTNKKRIIIYPDGNVVKEI